MDISMINNNFRHYRVFYLPVRGPYGPIMASNRKKRQSVQAGELFMNFNGTTGNLTNLTGSVTYSIQVAAVTTFNDDEVIGDRSAPVERTTLEGGKQFFTTTHFVSILCHCSAYCSPNFESNSDYQ